MPAPKVLIKREHGDIFKYRGIRCWGFQASDHGKQALSLFDT